MTLNNDAELGALGEWAYGAGRGAKNLAYIKVGSAYLGYLMVEPRRHVPGLEHLRDDEARALGVWLARLSRALVAVLGAAHVYAFVIGDHVRHVHVHVVARYPGAPPQYRGPRVDEWPEAPRGGEREIEALCERLRTWLSAHGADEALGS